MLYLPYTFIYTIYVYSIKSEVTYCRIYVKQCDRRHMYIYMAFMPKLR